MAIKVITSKFTSKEAKELLEKGQKLIDEKIKGPALKEKKEKIPKALSRDPIDLEKIDAGEGLKTGKIKKASIVSESMLCFVLADAMLEKFGGDTMEQLKDHINITGKY